MATPRCARALCVEPSDSSGSPCHWIWTSGCSQDFTVAFESRAGHPSVSAAGHWPLCRKVCSGSHRSLVSALRGSDATETSLAPASTSVPCSFLAHGFRGSGHDFAWPHHQELAGAMDSRSGMETWIWPPPFSWIAFPRSEPKPPCFLMGVCCRPSHKSGRIPVPCPSSRDCDSRGSRWTERSSTSGSAFGIPAVRSSSTPHALIGSGCCAERRPRHTAIALCGRLRLRLLLRLRLGLEQCDLPHA
jgi:hypothetical protein